MTQDMKELCLGIFYLVCILFFTYVALWVFY